MKKEIRVLSNEGTLNSLQWSLQCASQREVTNENLNVMFEKEERNVWKRREKQIRKKKKKKRV